MTTGMTGVRRSRCWQWLALAALVVCSVQVQADPDLRVGISPHYRPMAFYKNGELTGIEVALAREAGQILQRRVRFVELPRNELVAALKAGKVDVVMSPVRLADAKDKGVIETDPYMKVGQMAIIRAGDAGRLAPPRAIFRLPVTVGVQKGSAGEAYADEHWPKNKIVAYPSPELGLQALHDHKIDVFIHDSPTSWEIANSPRWGDLMSLYRPLTHETLNWLVRADNQDLRQQLNDVIDSLRESGRLSAIESYWIPVQVEVD